VQSHPIHQPFSYPYFTIQPITDFSLFTISTKEMTPEFLFIHQLFIVYISATARRHVNLQMFYSRCQAAHTIAQVSRDSGWME